MSIETLIMPTGILIEGTKGKEVKLKGTNFLIATLNLGKYVYCNNLIDSLQKGELFVQNEYIQANNSINTGNNKALKMDNSIIKKAKNKIFDRLLKEWINYCGIQKEYLHEYEDRYEVYPEDVKKILIFSKNVYLKLENIINNKKEKISFKIEYEYEYPATTNKIKKKFLSLIDAVNYELINYPKSDSRKRYLKQCEYCSDFFIGGKLKKTCSTTCKDLKNEKTRKRKERESKRNDTTIK